MSHRETAHKGGAGCVLGEDGKAIVSRRYSEVEHPAEKKKKKGKATKEGRQGAPPARGSVKENQPRLKQSGNINGGNAASAYAGWCGPATCFV